MSRDIILVEGAVPTSAVNALVMNLGGVKVIQLKHRLVEYAERINLIEQWSYPNPPIFDLQDDLKLWFSKEFDTKKLGRVQHFAYDSNGTDSSEEKSIDVNLLIDYVLRPILGNERQVLFHEWNGAYWSP